MTSEPGTAPTTYASPRSVEHPGACRSARTEKTTRALLTSENDPRRRFPRVRCRRAGRVVPSKACAARRLPHRATTARRARAATVRRPHNHRGRGGDPPGAPRPPRGAGAEFLADTARTLCVASPLRERDPAPRHGTDGTDRGFLVRLLGADRPFVPIEAEGYSTVPPRVPADMLDDQFPLVRAPGWEDQQTPG